MVSNRLVLFLTVVAICWAVAAVPLFADSVIEWNRIASDVLLRDTDLQNPGVGSRTMAMMNLAMYDTVNGISPRYQQFYAHDPAPPDCSINAAASQSAYRILSSIYSEQEPFLQAELSTQLASIADSAAKANGIAYGDAVARTIIEARQNDGFDRMVTYVPQGGVGHWEPDPMNPSQQAWGPQWGGVTPFAIRETNEFMPRPMPELTSVEYAEAFNEVKSLGALHSPTRTDEQTQIGLFWAYDRLGMGTPIRMYNGILRTVAENEGHDLVDNSKMFAMSATTMADAGITAWDAKFLYDFWRPISGIRQADADGNPATESDPDWVPLAAPGGVGPDGTAIPDFTPPFPTYVSGHASFGSALFASLANFFERDDISFEVTSEEVPGVTRSFDSFHDAMVENGRSRVYLGIHWNFDDLVARELGQQIADDIATQYFQPVPEPTGLSLLLGAMLTGLLMRRR